MYYDGHMDGGDWVVMGAWMTFLLVLVLVAVWAIARWTTGASGPEGTTTGDPARRPTAREILDDSLARGDITVDEYEKRRAAIERST